MTAPTRPTLAALGRYFLGLGTYGFGGPVALAGAMQRELVERRHWFTREEYLEALALAQLAPGPLAAQLAIYLGWIRARLTGATVVAAAFILPSFVMVLALSALYVRWSGLPWMRGVFYGVGAAVIAVVARGVVKLGRMTLGRRPLAWTLCAANAIVTAWTGREVVALLVASGAVAALVAARPRTPGGSGRAMPALLLALPPWLLSGLHGAATAQTIGALTAFFAQAGLVVFGSGLAIVPFLHGGVVERMHWLTDRQFLDAVAVAMITPGPVVITVAFIGYLVAGPLGACGAAVGVFLPCYLVVVVLAPHYRRLVRSPGVAAFVGGVTAAAAGALAGSVWVLGRRAIVDLPTALIALATLAALVRWRRMPEPVWILAAALVGLVLRPV